MHKGSKLIWHVAVKGALRIGLSSKTHVSIEVSPGRHETQMTFDVEGIGISGSRNSSSFLVATFNVDFTLVVGVRTLFVTTRSAGVRTRLHEEGKPGEALLTSPSVFSTHTIFFFCWYVQRKHCCGERKFSAYRLKMYLFLCIFMAAFKDISFHSANKQPSNRIKRSLGINIRSFPPQFLTLSALRSPF